MRYGFFLLLVACDPFRTELDDALPVRYEAASLSPPPETPETLVVMDWNVKFGGGRLDFFFDCFGDRVLMSREEVIPHLDRLAAQIRSVNPDIVLLQEVDVNAKRSAFIDQVQWLLDRTELNYGVYASQWRADFIPSDGIGAMDSGNAILSRWPLTDEERTPLALRTDQSALTRYFYLRRNVLHARVELPEVPNLRVVNVHTDAYGEDGTKRLHIEGFESVMDTYDAEGALLVGGGDLNTLPPDSQQLFDFDDSICEDEEFIADDYRPEVGWLDSLYEQYAPFVSLDDYRANNAAFFTHTIDGNGYWNRQLDYLFTNGRWQNGEVLQQGTMPLSDHAPLRAELVLP